MAATETGRGVTLHELATDALEHASYWAEQATTTTNTADPEDAVAEAAVSRAWAGHHRD